MCFHSVSDWVESTLVFPQDVAMFVFFPLHKQHGDDILQDGVKLQYASLGKAWQMNCKYTYTKEEN